MKYVSERGAAWVPPEGERVAPALLRHLISHLACKSVFWLSNVSRPQQSESCHGVTDSEWSTYGIHILFSKVRRQLQMGYIEFIHVYF